MLFVYNINDTINIKLSLISILFELNNRRTVITGPLFVANYVFTISSSIKTLGWLDIDLSRQRLYHPNTPSPKTLLFPETHFWNGEIRCGRLASYPSYCLTVTKYLTLYNAKCGHTLKSFGPRTKEFNEFCYFIS